MDWRTVFLAATLQNVLSLPMDICCPDSNPPLTGLSLLEKPIPVISSSLEFYFNQIKHNEGLSNDISEYREEDCCTNTLTQVESKQPSKGTRRENGMNLQRTKRFPIHLDPLYQYRYLARSGQCPTAKDGQPEFYCPTPDRLGNWRCIDDFQLCDGVRHCPNGEDELPVSCLFYRVVETHLHSVSQKLNSDENRLRRSPR